MRPPINDPLKPRCGNCEFWDGISDPKQAEPEMGICLGVPPSVVLVGSKPKQFSQGVELVIELMRPNLPLRHPPCAHHRMVQVPLLGTAKLNS